MQSFADSYAGRRDADPLRGLQPADQVPRAARHRPRARGGRAGHRPLHRSCAHGPGGPELYRAARRRARPELFPVRDHARAARAPAAFRSARYRQGRGARAGAQLRPAGRRQVRQPGHLLRAAGPLHRRHRAPEAGRRRGRRHRARRRPRARPRTAASSTTPSASGAGSASPAPAPLYVVRLDAATQAGRGRAARELARALDHA